MAYDFSKWSDEIAVISEEYQNCTIQIIDPSLVSKVYNANTNAWTITGNGTVYSGAARLIPIRSGLHQGGESQANATTIRAFRVQIPKGSTPTLIRKGLTVKVTAAADNTSLVGRTAKVTDDFQGSWSASRTFSVMMDIDSGLS